MSDDPYRTPGVVETDEERLHRWRLQLASLMISELRNWTPEEKQACADELRRLLTRNQL